jgi:hypothetical protein
METKQKYSQSLFYRTDTKRWTKFPAILLGITTDFVLYSLSCEATNAS